MRETAANKKRPAAATPNKKRGADVVDMKGKPLERPAPSPADPPADLEPPGWLTPAAREIWSDIVPALVDSFPDDVVEIDRTALALMITHLSIVQGAAADMDTGEGVAATDVDQAHRDRLRKHPASQVLRDHGKSFMDIAREFGLTPKARRDLALGKPVDPDPDDDDDLFE